MDVATQLCKQSECFRLVYDIGGRYVNDHCLIQARDGVWHFFHITGPIGKGCYDAGSEVSFGHATSRDLQTWQAHPDVLGTDPRSRHEPHHVFAPYVCEREGRYYLFYSGINVDLKMESMCLACSDDLFEWRKHPFNPVFRPSRQWAEHSPGSGTWACCRDPHVLADPKHGYILYYVTWMKGTARRGGASRLVALGAAVSENLVSWQDAGPVMVREMATDHSTTSMESPCVVAKDGVYHLFYKHRDETRLATSDDPLMFTDRQDRCFSIAHAAEVFQAGGRWYITHCSRDPLDVGHKTSDRTKGLFIAGLEWEQGGPRVVSPTWCGAKGAEG